MPHKLLRKLKRVCRFGVEGCSAVVHQAEESLELFVAKSCEIESVAEISWDAEKVVQHGNNAVAYQ